MASEGGGEDHHKEMLENNCQEIWTIKLLREEDLVWQRFYDQDQEFIIVSSNLKINR